jgi:hypothetical protein
MAKGRKPQPPVVKKVLADLTEGWTVSDTARRNDLTRNTVRRIRDRTYATPRWAQGLEDHISGMTGPPRNSGQRDDDRDRPGTIPSTIRSPSEQV